MYLRSQSQPEEEETGKEWKALGPIHFDRLPRIGLQEILWEFRDDQEADLSLKKLPIFQKKTKIAKI